MKRRWVVIMVGVFGVAGAFGVICTLGVAWTIAMKGDLGTFRGQYRTQPPAWRTPGYLADVLPPPKSGREMPGRILGYRQIATDFPVPTERGLDGGWFTVWSTEFGWPWYAVRWDSMNFRAMKPGVTGDRVEAIKSAFDSRAGLNAGIELTPSTQGARQRRLPTGIIWPGFLGNSAVFGAAGVVVVGGLWALIKGVKRWSRRRRGACPGCGYDARGLMKCPECGRENAVAGEGPSGRAA